jgi:transcriptional regulator with XRE-family HTH domain
MSAGEAVAQARKDKGVTQDQLSMNLYCSREAVSKYETGDRKIPKDLRPSISQALDDPHLYMEMAMEATGRVGIPVLNGDYIDKHPASMSFLVQREADEALDHVRQMDWVKPVEMRTDQEKQDMRKVVMELLDSIASMMNLVAVICKVYKFSMKEIFEAWRVTLKARRMVQK